MVIEKLFISITLKFLFGLLHVDFYKLQPEIKTILLD